MQTFGSSGKTVRIEQSEPLSDKKHAALLVLHGAGGAGSFWFGRFAPMLAQAGIAAYAPHYFDKTGTVRATRETILDGYSFAEWLAAARDAVTYIAGRPGVDPERIGVVGVSLGGYLAMALAVDDRRIRAAVEVSGGMPAEWAKRALRGMPPVLAVHGMEDQVVPAAEAETLGKLLAERDVPHRVELLPGEGHWFSSAAGLRLLGICSDFLEEHLVGAPCHAGTALRS